RPHTRSKRDWSSDVCSSDLQFSSSSSCVCVSTTIWTVFLIICSEISRTFSSSSITSKRCLYMISRCSLRTSSKDKIVLRSEEHTSELQSRFDLVCRLLLEKK